MTLEAGRLSDLYERRRLLMRRFVIVRGRLSSLRETAAVRIPRVPLQ